MSMFRANNLYFDENTIHEYNIFCALFHVFNTQTCSLNHFTLIFNFYFPWKLRKTRRFLTFSGGREMENWRELYKKLSQFISYLYVLKEKF